MRQLSSESFLNQRNSLGVRARPRVGIVWLALTAAGPLACTDSGSKTSDPVGQTSDDDAGTLPGPIETTDLPPVGTVEQPDTPSTSPGFGGADVPMVTIDDESTDDMGVPDLEDGLQPCAQAVALGGQPLVDDFEDDDFDLPEVDGRAASWYSYNSEDDSSQVFVIEEMSGLPSGGGRALHSTGSGYEWSGIGMGLRWAAPDAESVWLDCVYDASVYDGVRFWARGNGGEARLTISVPGVIPIDEGGTCDSLESPCWANHGIDLAPGDDWVEYYVPFADMLQPDWGNDLGPLDTKALRTLQFEFPTNADFDIWLDDIGFYSGEPMPRDPVPFVPAPVDPMPDAGPVVDPPVDPPIDMPDAGPPELGDAGTAEPGDAG
jgi:hypothetical protein